VPPSAIDFFVTRFLSGPVAFAISRELFGLGYQAYHVTPFVLHLTNCWLLWRVLNRLGQPWTYGATAALVMALHPAAYTALAWLAVGFNEIPALTLCLASTLLVLDDLERPHVWKPLLAIACVVVAAGFKQHAIVAPVYLLAFGIVRRLDRARPVVSTWRLRLAAPVLALGCFSLWFVWQVVPLVVERYGPPYHPVWQPTSVARSMLRLLTSNLNPVPVLREALGCQQAIPLGFSNWLGVDAIVFELALVGGLCVVIWMAATQLGRRPLCVALWAVLFCALVIPSSLPSHLYDYYGYFGLPAAAALLALPLELGRRHAAEWVWPSGAFVRSFGVLLAIAYAWGASWLLHGSNTLVEQANHARRVDEYARGLPEGTTIYFVPPVERAKEDTLSGFSVATMQGERGIGVVFAGQPGVAPVEHTTDLLRLTAFDDLGSGDWRVFALDQANTANATRDRIGLAEDEELVQPIVVGRRGLTELQARASFYGGGCSVVYRLEQHTTAASLSTSPPTRVVASGAYPCATVGRDQFFPIVHIPPQWDSRDVPYDLHLTLRAEAAPRGGRVLLATGVAQDNSFLPLMRRTVKGAWQPLTPTGRSLLLRVVVSPDRPGR
jgi:hypothetical protein